MYSGSCSDHVNGATMPIDCGLQDMISGISPEMWDLNISMLVKTIVNPLHLTWSNALKFRGVHKCTQQ